MYLTDDLENKGTAKEASDASKGQPSDSPTDDKGQKASDSPTDGEGLDENGKPLPFGEHPKWKSARQAEKRLHELMEANDLDSIEDLVDLIESGKKVIGKITDLENIDELIEKAQKLDQWTEYYAQQAEIEKEKGEKPEETIARLKAELVKKDQREARENAARESESLLKNYSKTVEATVDEVLKDLPESQKGFITEFFGVGNPFAVIDIADKRAVKKMVIDGKKKLEAFKTQIIKNYIAGKEEIPTVTTTGESTTTSAPKITMRTAREILRQRWKT